MNERKKKHLHALVSAATKEEREGRDNGKKRKKGKLAAHFTKRSWLQHEQVLLNLQHTIQKMHVLQRSVCSDAREKQKKEMKG